MVELSVPRSAGPVRSAVDRNISTMTSSRTQRHDDTGYSHHVEELYGIKVSASRVSAVTDAVMDDVRTGPSRPLESTYAVVCFDALRVNIRAEGVVRNKAV